VANLYKMLDLQTPWSLYVAATLRLPEHVEAGHGEVGDLAAVAGCDRDALYALLRYLVANGVFDEVKAGTFACNELARKLGAAQFIDLNGIGGRMAHSWGTMLGYVRTGKSGYQEVFGLPFWADLTVHPDVAADFDALMGPPGHGMPDYDIELTGGWDGIREIADVGGGTGAMLVNLLRRHPRVRGTLVDLPATVACADLGEVADRVTLAGQSFFDPLPAGADLYLLKKVLNDWPDAETVAILTRCREAAGVGGRVVVAGGVTPDDEPPSLSIDMLVTGGKTSMLTPFRDLARQAGLRVAAASIQPSGNFVVELKGTP
jgi:2,7-dihydroxy-5-methyl-1-naphthoate 7-O-methyltransferase